MTRTPPDGGGLFPPFPHGGPMTSLEAAREVACRTPTMRARVHAFIRSRGARGATDAEGAEALGMRIQTYGPRRFELVRSGVVVDSGERRRTDSGCRAIVWLASEFVQAGGGG